MVFLLTTLYRDRAVPAFLNKMLCHYFFAVGKMIFSYMDSLNPELATLDATRVLGSLKKETVVHAMKWNICKALFQ